jgi:multidrug efflux pump subunit AcrA (membrane-fusion protein)
MVKYFLPAVGIGMLALGTWHAFVTTRHMEKRDLIIVPPRGPFSNSITAAGLVEAQTENIEVGAHLSGRASDVFVKVGQTVRQNDPLFRLDDRHVQAELKVRAANLATAKAELEKLDKLPRAEDVTVSETRIREADGVLVQAKDQYERTRQLVARQAVSEQSLVQDTQAFHIARERLAHAKAEHALLLAGTWEPNKAIARAQV